MTSNEALTLWLRKTATKIHLVPFTTIAFLVLLFFLLLEKPILQPLSGVRKIDWMGITSIIVSTLMLLIGIQIGGSIVLWNSHGVISMVIIGTAGFGVFLRVELAAGKISADAT